MPTDIIGNPKCNSLWETLKVFFIVHHCVACWAVRHNQRLKQPETFSLACQFLLRLHRQYMLASVSTSSSIFLGRRRRWNQSDKTCWTTADFLLCSTIPPSILSDVMKKDMDLERIGSRQRDKSTVFAEESQALDQIAKEVIFHFS